MQLLSTGPPSLRCITRLTVDNLAPSRHLRNRETNGDNGFLRNSRQAWFDFDDDDGVTVDMVEAVAGARDWWLWGHHLIATAGAVHLDHDEPDMTSCSPCGAGPSRASNLLPRPRLLSRLCGF